MDTAAVGRILVKKEDAKEGNPLVVLLCSHSIDSTAVQLSDITLARSEHVSYGAVPCRAVLSAVDACACGRDCLHYYCSICSVRSTLQLPGDASPRPLQRGYPDRVGGCRM